MKIVFISGGVNPQTINMLVNNYKLSQYGYSQQWWDYTMAKGLFVNLKEDVFFISVPPIPTFPSSKCLVLPKIQDNYIGNYMVLNGINLPILKQIGFEMKLKKELKQIIKANKDEQIIILTSYIYYYFAKPALQLKKKYSNVKIATFVPDLPDMYKNNSFEHHDLLKRLFEAYRKKCIKAKDYYDAYLCFSAHQMKYLNAQRPYCVIDGVIDEEIINTFERISDEKDNVILYAGGVHYSYGIKELIDGFIKAKLQNVRLLVYGNGDATDYVKNKEDDNVIYCGSANRSVILEKEKRALLLINPRPIDNDFSDFSFPSKLIEYMASGTTVITSRLRCITEEYNDYMLFIDNITSDKISEALTSYFNNLNINMKIGTRAKEYIQINKNASYQAKKTIEFLKDVFQ